MGQFEDLKLFAAVVQHGSIARASTELGIAKSAVSRRLAQLEGRYDTRLIDRQPGMWGLTEAGKELYQRAVPMLADAEDLDADFTPAARKPSGPLRVTIAQEFGRTFLEPMLLQFAQTHPQIDLTLDFDDRTIDLDRENYDLAVRITAQNLDGTSQVKLGVARHGLFASPGYLQRHGTPQEPGDLRQHALLHYGASRRPTWAFGYLGQKVKIAFKPALNSNAGAFLAAAAKADHGIIRLPDFVVTRAVQQGALVPVLPQAQFEEFGIYLIHSANRRLNTRMRAFIEAVRTQCAVFQG